MSAIFISYRRDDTEGQAGRLFEGLRAQFGANAVFMDVAGIDPGRDFRQVIDTNVAQCGVLLALIGRQWLTAEDAEGRRRIDNPQDFVRLETASALKREIPVVPVLVQGAQMPSVAQLPPDLADLAYRNAVELTHARWDSDVQVLVGALRKLIGADSAARPPATAATAMTSAPPPAAAPRPTPAPTAGVPAGRSGKGLAALGLLAVALAAGGVAIYQNTQQRRQHDAQAQARAQAEADAAQQARQAASAAEAASQAQAQRAAASAAAEQLARQLEQTTQEKERALAEADARLQAAEAARKQAEAEATAQRDEAERKEAQRLAAERRADAERAERQRLADARAADAKAADAKAAAAKAAEARAAEARAAEAKAAEALAAQARAAVAKAVDTAAVTAQSDAQVRRFIADARKLSEVVLGDINGNRMGRFARAPDGSWSEFDLAGKRTATYRQVSGDESAVQLWDDSRQIGVNLNLRAQGVGYRSGDQGPYRRRFQMLSAQ